MQRCRQMATASFAFPTGASNKNRRSLQGNCAACSLQPPRTDVPGLKRSYGCLRPGPSGGALLGIRSEEGQGAVEWVGLSVVLSLLLLGLVAGGIRVPGTALARALASRLLCVASLADGCGDEPSLIAAYGTEVGKLIRRHMPTILFEQGSRAMPVDFRRCRSSGCGDGSPRGLAHRTDAGLPLTAFVHVVDCRADGAEASEAAGGAWSRQRAGHLYPQVCAFYAHSAPPPGVPLA